MAVLRSSMHGFGLSILTLLTHLGCGGAVDEAASNGPSGSQGGSTSGGTTSSINHGGAGLGGSVSSGAGAGGTLSSIVCTPTSDVAGFIGCDGGWIHRDHTEDCPNMLPRATSCTDASLTPVCKVDSDCRTAPYGRCDSMIMGGCSCNYGCVSDSDCAAGQICQCGDPVGHCTTASCSTDADCGGGLCSTYDYTPGCGGVGFACTQALDACRSGSECPGGYCVLAPAGNRTCSAASCVIGRPFLIHGEDRRASLTDRDDWSETHTASLIEDMPPEQRLRLGQHYAEIGLMEHAAVAAFARLVLELIGHAAPADLIERAILAQVDEARHAQLAFGLATQLLGVKTGPGRLELGDARLGCTLEELAYTTVIEGCVGETIAALEASEAKERADRASIREIFERISTDESAHASLSWRIAAWLVQVGGANVHRTVRQAFADAEAQSSPPRATCDADEAFGALDSETAAELRSQAFREVIAPCRERLLASVKQVHQGATRPVA